MPSESFNVQEEEQDYPVLPQLRLKQMAWYVPITCHGPAPIRVSTRHRTISVSMRRTIDGIFFAPPISLLTPSPMVMILYVGTGSNSAVSNRFAVMSNL